jgi:hypothetical protein
MKFRKKPIVIDAEQVSETQKLCSEFLPFYKEAQYHFDLENGFKVYDYLHKTWVSFEPGDYIIKGIQGEFYPCKKDIFEQTYEKAE